MAFFIALALAMLAPAPSGITGGGPTLATFLQPSLIVATVPFSGRS